MKDNIKYAFSVDALSSSARHSWRLCGDYWRTIIFAEDVQSSDKLLDIVHIMDWIGIKVVKDKTFGLRLINQDNQRQSFFFFTRAIFTHAIIHRFASLPLASLADLTHTIASTQASNIVWLPIIDLDGNFRCLNSHTESIAFNPSIAVRGELCSSAMFIGASAADNSHYIQSLYASFAAGWYDHLRSRKYGIFIPDNKETPPLELIQEKLAQWQPESLL